MIDKIPFEKDATFETVAEIVEFFWWLSKNGVSFHPDDDFNDYVDRDGNPSFTPYVAECINEIMNTIWDGLDHKDDIYTIGMAVDTTLTLEMLNGK